MVKNSGLFSDFLYSRILFSKLDVLPILVDLDLQCSSSVSPTALCIVNGSCHLTTRTTIIPNSTNIVNSYGSINVIPAINFEVPLTRFGVGIIAYNCIMASQKGILEAIYIKKYKIFYNSYNVIYTDTLNALWNEEELCNYVEAQKHIDYYNEVHV